MPKNEERTSELYERLEAIRLATKIKGEVPSRFAFSKIIGLTPVKYDNTKDVQGITPAWEIALQAMDKYGGKFIKLPEEEK